MACACRGRNRAGGKSSSGATITGFEFTSPSGEVKVFLTHPEAKAERRRAGGGTILQLTK